METQRRTKGTNPKSPVPAQCQREDKKAAKMANLALDPAVASAVIVKEYTKDFGHQEILALVEALNRSISDAKAGDLSQAEAMLYAQANALQGIFMGLAHRASQQSYLKEWEAFLRMALKAQSQCRMTLETLAALKNPTQTVIARQANITSGPQQVNNVVDSTAKQLAPNKLLEPQNGQWMDPRAASTTGGSHPILETVGTL